MTDESVSVVRASYADARALAHARIDTSARRKRPAITYLVEDARV